MCSHCPSAVCGFAVLPMYTMKTNCKSSKRSNPQKQSYGSTFRAAPPEATRARLEPIIARIGITRVAHIGGLDNLGVPTSVCIRPDAKHLCTSQGKGNTSLLADISAIMESVEGYHAENVPVDQEFVSLRQLGGAGRVVDPRVLPPGPRWKAWSPTLPMRWVSARDLVDDKPTRLPYILVTLDSTQAHPEFAIFSASSNGLASGNTLAEAMCHA